uniref:Fatty acid hydroxylase domain-containing protein n=1 Tax=Pygocentrus nattereri TaxID=42514 RepID=A0A3B4C2G8_PYGNA
MWNVSKVTLQLSTTRASDRLFQPLWDYLVFHHYSLVSSPFFPLMLTFSSYFLFSCPFAILDLLGEQSPAFYGYMMLVYWSEILQGYKCSLRCYFYICYLVSPQCFVQFLLDYNLLCLVVGALLWGAWCLDTQYFFWHVAHHKNSHLYKWVYAIHHYYISPFFWSIEHLSAVEVMTVGFWSNLDPLLLQCHPLTTWTLTVFSIWLSVEDHIGYDLPWTPSRLVPFGLLGGALAHDLHHQKPSSNFAPFFSHWDRLFGTSNNVVKKVFMNKTASKQH